MFERIRRWFRREEQAPKWRRRKKRDPYAPLHVRVRRERAEKRERDIVEDFLYGRDYDKPSEDDQRDE